MARYWLFTIFSPLTPQFIDGTFEYLAFQRERCPDTGREHLQLFLVTNRKARMPSALFKISNICKTEFKGHWEVARDPARAREYCLKEDTRIEGPWEHGICPTFEKGRKSEIRKFLKIRADSDIATAAEQFPECYIRNFRGNYFFIIFSKTSKIF